MSWEVSLPDEATIRFEVQNSKPVDLFDLTSALSAFGEAYRDRVVQSGLAIEGDEFRLYVKEIRTGSTIADLISLDPQITAFVEHIDLATNFVTHLHHVAQFFLLSAAKKDLPVPTKREAEQVMQIMEPVAKDGSSQLIVQVHRDLNININQPPIVSATYNSQQANAIQNSARRFLGPKIPTTNVYHDELLTLFQMRADPESKVGDWGIIETISPKPLKLAFSSEDIKRKIVDHEDNPFQKVFVIDVEVKILDGKPKLYRILDVKDVMDRNDDN